MRVTEAPHPSTRALDTLPMEDQIRALLAAERGLFGEAEWGLGLQDPMLHLQLTRLAQKIAAVASDPAGQILIAGAGTSGRIALWAMAYLPTLGVLAEVKGLMAGGAAAFHRAREGAEDDAELGQADLLAQLRPEGPKVYIGMTCGLSAAYIAGQLALADNAGFDAVVLLGFNPLEAASDRFLESLGTSLKGLLHQSDRRIELVNPIIGPEPIAGSTRMKGGTASMILLDALFRSGSLSNRLLGWQMLQSRTFQGLETFLPPQVQQALTALHQGLSIVYRSRAASAFPAVLDAAECPPTFGVSGELIQVMLGSDFYASWPFIPRPSATLTLRHWLFDPLPFLASLDQGEQEASPFNLPQTLTAKWTFNAFSTLLFTAYGKIFDNRMIDLRISNLKLLQRAVNLISQLAHLDEEQARELLYQVLDCQGLEPHQIVSLAVRKEKVVPTALLMGLTRQPLAECRTMLQKYPKVADALRAASP